MSCALGRDGSAPDIAASLLRSGSGATARGSSAVASDRAPPFNSGMKLTAPGGDGAPQLIPRLDGRTLAGSLALADGGVACAGPTAPRLPAGRSLRPQHGEQRRPRARPRRRAWVGRLRRARTRACTPRAVSPRTRARSCRRATPRRAWPTSPAARVPSATAQRLSTPVHRPSATVHGRGLAGRPGAAWLWRPPCEPWCRAARRMTAPNGRARHLRIRHARRSS